jgi:hypothetical protein
MQKAPPLPTCQLLLDGVLGAGIDHFALKGCTLRGPGEKSGSNFPQTIENLKKPLEDGF